MILLRISYRVRAHQITPFETIFREEIQPLIQEHGLRFLGIWKSRVGNVGEFLELWDFEDISDFDKNFNNLLKDPRIQKIFKRTGPMVEGESFTLFEPAAAELSEPDRERYQV